MEDPGGRRPWCRCHFKDWLRSDMRRDGGTTDTSPDRAVGGGGREEGEGRGGEGRGGEGRGGEGEGRGGARIYGSCMLS